MTVTKYVRCKFGRDLNNYYRWFCLIELFCQEKFIWRVLDNPLETDVFGIFWIVCRVDCDPISFKEFIAKDTSFEFEEVVFSPVGG